MAGIGSAISLIFVVLAFFVKNLSLSFTILSSAGIMFPLTRNYYREAVLSALAVSVIGFFIVNLTIISFIAASGFYVVLTIFLHNKKFNRWIGYVLKFFYAGLVFFLAFKVLSLITVDLTKLPALERLSPAAFYAIFNLLFSACFLLYDFLLEKGYIYLSFLMKKVIKE